MKQRKTLHTLASVLALSLVGLIFYYTLWIITDQETKNMWKHGWPWNSWQTLIDYAAATMLTAVVTLYYWKSKEKTQRERDKFRLQALENQLSPHFVFNNFSILAHLIEVQPQKAQQYLLNLSKIYRYTLTHLDHETVTLQQEIDFINKYLELLKQRFGDSIQVNIQPQVTQTQGQLPPAALQIIIENAIKHNTHTTTQPLYINITTQQHTITVTNNKQNINTQHTQSTNLGQQNLVERYRLLTSKKVTIQQNNTHYSVTIPLID